jgi:hypothetical protein
MQSTLDKLQIDDPDQFKNDFETLKKDITKLKKQLSEKTNLLK